MRDETNPVPIATCPLPLRRVRERRRGSAPTTSTRTSRCRRSALRTILIGTFFGGGVGAYDISSPYQPREVGAIAPKAPRAPRGPTQLNDVFVDERGIVYTVDRHVGGLYVLEMDF